MQIEQIDREAAAKVAVLAEMRELILAGKLDTSEVVQAIASHREEGQLSERTAIVEWLRNNNKLAHASQRRAIAQLAEAIEHGQHWLSQQEDL